MSRDYPSNIFPPDPPSRMTVWQRRLIILGLAVMAIYALMTIAGKTMWAIVPEPVPEPEHVQQITATWGSFDEICLYRYYKRADYPEQPVAPGYKIAYDGETWSCIVCDDIIGTNFGDCWEAVFRKT